MKTYDMKVSVVMLVLALVCVTTIPCLVTQHNKIKHLETKVEQMGPPIATILDSLAKMQGFSNEDDQNMLDLIKSVKELFLNVNDRLTRLERMPR